MRLIQTALFAALLLCANLFGQSATPAGQALTFHVQGTVTDQNSAAIPNIEVVFKSEGLTKTLITDGTGLYESDLPLGFYSMDVHASGFRRYHRPPFSVTLPSPVTFDVVLPTAGTCDVVVVSATDEESEAATKKLCAGEELFTVASKNGVAFQLYVRYGKRTQKGNTFDYIGETRPVEDQVFVAYNLFSLLADHVIYDRTTRAVEARGNVVRQDESGKQHFGDWMTFTLENGQASLTGCLCRSVLRRKSK